MQIVNGFVVKLNRADALGKLHYELQFNIRFVATATAITVTTTMHTITIKLLLNSVSFSFSLILRIYGFYVSQSKDKQILDMSMDFFFISEK